MPRTWIRTTATWAVALCPIAVGLLFVHGCGDNSSSLTAPPAPSPGGPPPDTRPGSSNLDPAKLGLAYVCDLKFRATNANTVSATVTYKVDGTDETGSLALAARINDSTSSDTV